jgi:hypothetical protein
MGQIKIHAGATAIPSTPMRRDARNPDRLAQQPADQAAERDRTPRDEAVARRHPPAQSIGRYALSEAAAQHIRHRDGAAAGGEHPIPGA